MPADPAGGRDAGGTPGPLRVATCVVIGGGPDGALYVRQLRRAMAAGRLHVERILVVDRDPACAARVEAAGEARVVFESADWQGWLAARLSGLEAGDQLVPYHWAPHLLLDWLARQAEQAGSVVRRGGSIPARGLPFERETRQGDRALSYATWSCPPTCIEPALCPHTRGPKDWSLAHEMETVRPGDAWDGALVFPSFHLVWGVAAIPVGAIHAVRDRVLEAARLGRRRWLVTTASHCHGLAAVLEVEARPAARGSRPAATQS